MELKQERSLIILVAMAIVALFIVGCSRTVYIKSETILKTDNGEQIGKISVDAQAITDCGGIDCFEEKFALCQPATLTLEALDNLVYFYEIVGVKNDLCEVKSWFIANPNPNWAGPEMTCAYDNQEKFIVAVQDRSNCFGPLSELLNDAGGAAAESSPVEEEPIQQPENTKTTSAVSSDVRVEITFPKKEYAVNEKIGDAGASVKYDGLPFEGILLTTQEKEGTTYPSNKLLRTTFSKDNLPSVRLGSYYYKITSKGTVSSGDLDYFDEIGLSRYTAAVYDCLSLEESTGLPCSFIQERDLRGIEPLAKANKDIIVR